MRSCLTIPKVILGSYLYPKWVKTTKNGQTQSNNFFNAIMKLIEHVFVFLKKQELKYAFLELELEHSYFQYLPFNALSNDF